MAIGRDLAALADGDALYTTTWLDQLDAVADHRSGLDMAERADCDADAELGAGLDHGHRVDSVCCHATSNPSV